MLAAAVLSRMMFRSLPSVSKNRRLVAAAASSAPGLMLSLVIADPTPKNPGVGHYH